MKTLLTVLAFTLMCSVANAADFSGTYKVDGWDVGNLTINGDKFSLEVRDNEPETFCVVLKNGVIKENKGKSQVYAGNTVYFEIKKKGNSVQLIPKASNVVKVCNGPKVIEDAHPMHSKGYLDAIPKWKWKKIK